MPLQVLFLFYGVLVIQPKYLRPHLVVQAIGLVLSLAYFILYGWSYFYGDLYTQNRKFSVWATTDIIVLLIAEKFSSNISSSGCGYQHSCSSSSAFSAICFLWCSNVPYILMYGQDCIMGKSLGL